MGASTSWNPKGLSRSVMGLLYLYLYFPYIPHGEAKRNCKLILWSGFLTEHLIVAKLVKKIPAFYGTQNSISGFTTARP
jgi:hypothetical protein